MSEQPWNPLPEYEDPPVVETVLAAKFREIPGLDTLALQDFWNEHLRRRQDSPLPNASLQPPYTMPVELFGAASQLRVPPIRLTVQEAPPPLRHWFMSEDEQDLIQLQSDWAAVNWRKQIGQEYTRYPAGLQRFHGLWTDLEAFVGTRKLGALTPIQGEVSYINHIKTTEWGDLDKVISLFGPGASDARLSSPVGLLSNFAYLVTDDDDEPFARLHVSIHSAIENASGASLLVMNLTFRGRPHEQTLNGMERLFAAGHNWIVGAFDALTTTEMHNQWGKRRRA